MADSISHFISAASDIQWYSDIKQLRQKCMSPNPFLNYLCPFDLHAISISLSEWPAISFPMSDKQQNPPDNVSTDLLSESLGKRLALFE